MKKLLLFIFLTGYTTLTFAQQNMPSTIGIHTGISWVGVFTKLADHYNVVASINTTATPVVEVSYDRKMTHQISIGGGIARQGFSLHYHNYEYQDTNGNNQVDNFRTDLTRLHIGVRGLFHYFQSEKKEFYSGLRVGITKWSLDTNASDPKYQVAKYLNYALGVKPSFQVILFGFKGYFTPHLGANFETGIGSPHFASLGLVYRW